jgi:serine/threonine protein kinase
MNKKKLLCHRDLKPENFLINDNFDIVIADFGFCTDLITNEDLNGKATDREKNKTHYACRGTLQYMAPEILDQKICTKLGYNPE